MCPIIRNKNKKYYTPGYGNTNYRLEKVSNPCTFALLIFLHGVPIRFPWILTMQAAQVKIQYEIWIETRTVFIQ